MMETKEEKIDISIVIPAFNESKRLPSFLKDIIDYCKKSKYIYEIIVVDDGSFDDTAEAVSRYRNIFPSLFVYRLRENRGKGYAVKYGLFKSRGDFSLFMDADGSVSAEEIEKNILYLQEGYEIFVGSRVVKSQEQILKTRLHRKMMGLIFNYFVRVILFGKIKDTQCGFKIFKKEVVKPIFSRTNINGFGFDVEILYLAHKMGYKVKEGPVSWRHIRGSKVNVLLDSLQMFINIAQVRNWHFTPINPQGLYLGPDEYNYMFEMESCHWWFTSRNNLVIHLIKSLNKSFPMILDAGSGTGINLSLFGKFGNTFGIDISEEAIEFCLRRNLKRLMRCLIEQIGFKDRTFDLISCLDVLEHVDEPLKTLLELKRVLKDDGRIIITVPAFKFLWSQHDEALFHRRRYAKNDLISELHESGLHIEKIDYFFFTSFFLVSPIRILRKFLFKRWAIKSDTTTLPSRSLNNFLKKIFKLEIRISDYFRLPFGTTLYAIVSK